MSIEDVVGYSEDAAARWPFVADARDAAGAANWRRGIELTLQLQALTDNPTQQARVKRKLLAWMDASLARTTRPGTYYRYTYRDFVDRSGMATCYAPMHWREQSTTPGGRPTTIEVRLWDLWRKEPATA